MSKAFTREMDDLPERPGAPRLPPPVPFGVRNLLTPDGHARFRDELERLERGERPGPAGASGPDPAVIATDHRIAWLQAALTGAVPTPPPEHADDIRFGAWVTVREPDGTEVEYRLVGISETDHDRGWISWCSPLARALLRKRPGDTVQLRLPGGEQSLAVLRVRYA